jgi:HEPN domain-containing protein
MNKIHKIALRNDFAKRNFLGIADYEYIGARTLFRNECYDQFLTMAHQCIEKYMKAILLYNEKNTKFGHNLEKGLQKLEVISEIKLDKATISFIEELNHVRFARYLTGSFYGNSDFLLRLDATVWDLRLFCHNLKKPHFRLKNNSSKQNILNANIKGYSIIFSGELEKIIKNRNGKYKKLRENLVWKNFRYGKRRKNKINFIDRTWSKNPTFLLIGNEKIKKEQYEYLKKYVSFEREVEEYFDKI